MSNSDFEKVGVAFLSSSKRSVKLEIQDPTRVFSDVYYIAVKDVQTILAQPSKTAAIVKLKNEEG